MTKKELFFLIILILVDLLVVFLIYPIFSQIGTDGAIYATLGKNLAEGKGFTVYNNQPHLYFSPLFPIFISIVYLIFGNIEFSSHFVPIFFGAISLFIFYLLVRSFDSKKSAIIAALFFAFSGKMIWNYTTIPTPQFIATFFAILSFLAIYKFVSRKTIDGNAWLMLGGVSLGLAYLARPEYFFLIFLVAFYIFIIELHKFSIISALKKTIIIVVVFVLIIFPYLKYLHDNLGYWAFSARTISIAMTTSGVEYENLTVVKNDRVYTPVLEPVENDKSLLGAIFSNFGFSLKKLFKGLRNSERSIINNFGIVGIIFFGLGVFHFLLNKRYKELFLAIIFLIPIILIAFGQGGSPEYVMQLFYIFILFIAIGVRMFLYKIEKNFQLNNFRKNLLSLITILYMSGYLFFPIIQVYYFLPRDIVFREAKILGFWMKDNIDNTKEETIFARKPDYSFYAGAKWEIIPNVENFDKLFEIMRANDVKYLVADTRFFEKARPQFSSLLNPENNFPPELELIKTSSFYNNKAFLYKLK